MSTAASTIAPATQQVKERTADLHLKAEHAPFMAAMVRGLLPRQAYITMLGQALHLHRALERAVERAARSPGPLTRVARPEHRRTPHIERDLAFFGAEVPAPSAAARRADALIAEGEARGAIDVLGMQYVLEGSNNGNRFIARPVAKAYGLTPPDGLGFLLPHGEEQPRVWAAFKADLDACGMVQPEIDALVRGARQMYDAVMSLHDSLPTT